MSTWIVDVLIAGIVFLISIRLGALRAIEKFWRSCGMWID